MTRSPQTSTVLDRAVADGGIPGVVAEIRDGDRRWRHTAGVADLHSGLPRSPAERFRIGSTTKAFVATLVLGLAAEGRLRLDDPIDTWLPGLVDGGPRISLRRLLNHTSGIASYTDDQAALDQLETPTPEQLVGLATALPPAFAPGAGWAYSNTNYVLAGMIVEHVTGNPLADELTRRITEPLGLSGTSLPRGADPDLPEPHARHYTKWMNPDPDAEIHDVTEMDTAMFWAAGAMISTAGDLVEFFSALLGGRLLPPAQQREMFAVVPTRDWIPDTAYGLGISSVTLPGGATVWGMGGALVGSWSYTYGTRDGGHVLSVNVNGDWTTGGWADPIGVFTDLLVAEFG